MCFPKPYRGLNLILNTMGGGTASIKNPPSWDGSSAVMQCVSTFLPCIKRFLQSKSLRHSPFFRHKKSPPSQRASYTAFHRLSESSPYKGEKTLMNFQAQKKRNHRCAFTSSTIGNLGHFSLLVN